MEHATVGGGEHPVTLTVGGDLQRSRLTVFFRILLAIPHLIWLFLWGIAAFLAAIANWFFAIFAGRPAHPLHRFLSRYVHYMVHVDSYLFLIANPYPAFDGTPGRYDVDVTLPEPTAQSRWKIFFRLVLAIPALMLGTALGGGFPSGGYSRGGRSSRYQGGFNGGALLFACGFLGWFACLARGRMPKGLRDAGAFGIGYGAQALSYLFLVTDRYPDPDPATILSSVEPPPLHPVRLEVTDDLRRSRLTVFFRLFLALPHIVWIVLWAVAMVFVAIANWFVTLFRGTPAAPLHRFTSAFIRYGTHLSAFLYIVANPFPGFVGAPGTYPIDVDLPPPERQHRAITGFRIFLVIPAWVVTSALSGALFVAGVFMWFTGLVLGRSPRSLRNLAVYALRYSAQVDAYFLFVTDRYPHASPLDGAAERVHDEEAWTPPFLETAEPDSA